MEYVMMTGLDGSGRREYAQTIGHTVVHTEDEAVALLKSGTSCVLDAPNLRARSRKAFLERLGRIRCRRRIVLTARNVDLCKGALPDEAETIHDQYLSFYPPQPYEGWDDITLLFAEDTQFTTLDELFFGQNGLVFLSQDNPFHKHSVGMHCIRAARNAAKLRPDSETLWLAALLHDIGKAQTKAFVNSHGQPSPTAHYYGHEFASAYESLFVRFPNAVEERQRLRISALIVWHMMPHHFIGNDKTRARYERLWGADFMRDVLLIEQCDREAQN